MSTRTDLVQLQTSKIAVDFNHVVVAGNSIVFYDVYNGFLLIVSIDQAGHLVTTQNSQVAKNWYLLADAITYDPID